MIMAGFTNQPPRRSTQRLGHRPGPRIADGALGELPEQDIDQAAAIRAEVIFHLSNELSRQRRHGGLPRDIAELERQLREARGQNGRGRT